MKQKTMFVPISQIRELVDTMKISDELHISFSFGYTPNGKEFIVNKRRNIYGTAFEAPAIEVTYLWSTPPYTETVYTGVDALWSIWESTGKSASGNISWDMSEVSRKIKLMNSRGATMWFFWSQTTLFEAMRFALQEAKITIITHS